METFLLKNILHIAENQTNKGMSLKMNKLNFFLVLPLFYWLNIFTGHKILFKYSCKCG
jgi:hypothetical protein